MLAFSSLTNGRELFFKAERSERRRPLCGRAQLVVHRLHASGERWALVELSMAPSDLYSERLSQLPPEPIIARVDEWQWGVWGPDFLTAYHGDTGSVSLSRQSESPESHAST